MKIEITPDELVELMNGLNNVISERIRLIVKGVIDQEQIKKEAEHNERP